LFYHHIGRKAKLLVPEEIDRKYENRKNHEQKLTAAKKEASDRQKQVHSLDLQGFTNQQIADNLGVSLSTIEKDLHEVRENIRDWFSDIGNLDRYQAFVDAVIHLDSLQRELWKMARDSKDPIEKIKIYDTISKNAIKKTQLFKSSESYLSDYYFKQKDLSAKEKSREAFLDSLR